MSRINTDMPNFTLTALDMNDFTNMKFGATMKNQDANGFPRIDSITFILLNSPSPSDQVCQDTLYDGTSDLSKVPTSLDLQNLNSPCLTQHNRSNTNQVISIFISTTATSTDPNGPYSRIFFYPPEYTGTLPTTAGALPSTAVARDWSLPTPAVDFCVQDGTSQKCGAITGDNNNLTNLCVITGDAGTKFCGLPSCKDTVGNTAASPYCNVSTVDNGCDPLTFNIGNCLAYWIFPNWNVLWQHEQETLNKVWDHFPFSIFRTFSAFFTALNDTSQPQQGFLIQVKPICWDAYTAVQQTQNWQDTTTSLCGGYTQSGQLNLLGENSLGDKVLTLLRPISTAALLSAIWIGLAMQTIRVYWVENSRINRVGK